MKIIGLCLVFVCSVGIGLFTAETQKTALKQAKEMLNFMYYIKQQIEYFNTPLGEIYTSFENQNNFILSLVEDISVNGWKIALKEKKDIFLPSGCVSILYDFGNILGKSDRKDQLEKCDYYIREFEIEYQKLKDTTPKKVKASFALSVYIGLMIIILFL